MGTSVLMQAAASGNVDAVSALLKAGAAVDATDAHGDTALMIAAREGRPEVLRALLAAGADKALRNHDRASAQDIARGLKHANLVALLEAR